MGRHKTNVKHSDEFVPRMWPRSRVLGPIARAAVELEKAAEEASKVGGVNQVVSYVRLRNERGEIVPYSPGSNVAYETNELLGGPGS